MTPGVSALRSGLFDATVRHERLEPKRHAFTYRLFYLALDLDELPQLRRQLRLLRVNGRGVASFQERDYFPFGAPGGALKSRVLAWCAAQGHDAGPDGRVVLVTLPRILGYLFNPVSFYFCSSGAGEPVAAVAEVTNTFRETKPFLVPLAGGGGRGELGADMDERRVRPVFRARHVKEFYVSPFSSVDVAFDFTFHAPGERLAIRIDDYEGERRTLHSTLVGQRCRLGDAAVAWRLLRHPLLTLRVIGLIHWQAARLWAKAVPHFAKAHAADRQRGFHSRKGSVSP